MMAMSMNGYIKITKMSVYKDSHIHYIKVKISSYNYSPVYSTQDCSRHLTICALLSVYSKFNKLPSRAKLQTECEQGSLWLIECSLIYKSVHKLVLYIKIKKYIIKIKKYKLSLKIHK